jgi:hypothetical protein
MEDFSATQKDLLLFYLCENCKFEKISDGPTPELLKELNLTYDTLDAILYYFQRLKFISDLNLTQRSIYFILHLEANDFKIKGGFTFQEEILESNLQKIKLELENLKKQLQPEQLSTAEKISTILSTVMTAISLFKTP